MTSDAVYEVWPVNGKHFGGSAVVNGLATVVEVVAEVVVEVAVDASGMV